MNTQPLSCALNGTSRRLAAGLLAGAVFCTALGAPAWGQKPSSGKLGPHAPRANRLYVTPNGPDDGGDFGPKTPGTRTSGLQEAFNAAKARGTDLYIAGGSWTAEKTPPIVYVLHETLRIPWMQDFRLDSGHCVIHHAQKTGDGIVIDSQMSCYYRFGILVSESSGATVRLKPTTAGPDRFKVLTTTEFHINALVGGGGAWPGGEAYNDRLDPKHRWIGTGLWLDAADGPIDGNKISVVEIVGCGVGLRLSGPCTHNVIEAPMVHLCLKHLQVGGPGDSRPTDNRFDAFLHSQGIAGAVGAELFGSHNLLTLNFGEMAAHSDIVFQGPAQRNLVTVARLPHGYTSRAERPTNRITGVDLPGLGLATPPFPASGATLVQPYPFSVEVRVTRPGSVRQWTESDDAGHKHTFEGGLTAGQSFILQPGDRVQFHYDNPPAWLWKAVP